MSYTFSCGSCKKILAVVEWDSASEPASASVSLLGDATIASAFPPEKWNSPWLKCSNCNQFAVVESGQQMAEMKQIAEMEQMAEMKQQQKYEQQSEYPNFDLINGLLNSIPKHHKEYGVKLLIKCFQKILQNPNNTKYHNLNLSVVTSKLKHSQIFIQLMFISGFHKSEDGKRLLFNLGRLDQLTIVNNMLLKVAENNKATQEMTLLMTNAIKEFANTMLLEPVVIREGTGGCFSGSGNTTQNRGINSVSPLILLQNTVKQKILNSLPFDDSVSTVPNTEMGGSIMTVLGTNNEKTANQQNRTNNNDKSSENNGDDSSQGQGQGNTNNNNNNNQNGSNPSNHSNGGDDDDDKNNDKNNKNTATNNEKKDEPSREQVHKFFDILANISNITDMELSNLMATFSPMLFKKVFDGYNEINQAFKRISTAIDNTAQLRDVYNYMDMDMDGYSTDSSCYCHKINSKALSKPTKIISLITGFVREIDHECDQVELLAVNDIIKNNYMDGYSTDSSCSKKKRRKKKRKKKRFVSKPYAYYKPLISPLHVKVKHKNNENENKIKKYILSGEWYAIKNIRNNLIIKNIYGQTAQTGKITLSLEISEFMRRCKRFISTANVDQDMIQLIPFSMQCINNKTVVDQYLFVFTIDNDRNIDIGVSFICNTLCDNRIEVTGYHLNAEYIKSSSYISDLSNILRPSYFKIDDLKIYGQTEQYYERGYNKLKSFLQTSIQIESTYFVFDEWKNSAKKLWSENVGTPFKS